MCSDFRCLLLVFSILGNELNVSLLRYELGFFLKRFIYRQRGREGEKEVEKHQCVVASRAAPYWGPVPQPRHVP